MKLDIRMILLPLEEDLSPEPCVSIADRITKAIETMLKNDLRRIAVTDGGKVIGMITLQDALKKVGLKEDLKYSDTPYMKAQETARKGGNERT